MDKFYITTTLPYVNAPPHLGHALEFVQADIIARHHKIIGDEVFFNVGTDEHGLKIYREAIKSHKNPQEYADEYAAKFKKFCEALNINYTKFIRTTDLPHLKAAQEFWKRCDQNGDIYKGLYKVKYCVGCELEKTESELINGHCPIHPSLKIELIEEENYFFRFSRYQKPLLDFYASCSDFVIPDFRFNEIKNFVAAGLQDFSVSRLKAKMPWGIPVPNDPEQVMYVWFDALINYISTLGWPKEKEKFLAFWGSAGNPKAIQIAGKDNLRQQSAMWQAMLMSAGLPPSKQIIIHGFITSGREKMSKSRGNVVSPFVIIEKYGADALRFWLAHDMNPFEDGDFTLDKFKKSYNANLANGLGNFASRVLTLGEKLKDLGREQILIEKEIEQKIKNVKELVFQKLGGFKFNEAAKEIWDLISFGDAYVNKTEVWAIKDEKIQNKIIFNLIVILDNVAALLKPFLPETSERITKSIVWRNKTLFVKKPEILFPRITEHVSRSPE